MFFQGNCICEWVPPDWKIYVRRTTLMYQKRSPELCDPQQRKNSSNPLRILTVEGILVALSLQLGSQRRLTGAYDGTSAVIQNTSATIRCDQRTQTSLPLR